jgi:peptidoglycan/LPS O-acetylase OafA/YrhL
VSASDSLAARRPATSRLVAIDGLRGTAAALVILFHAQWPNHLTGMTFFRNSFLAVDLFFILSGLVISEAYAERIRGPADIRQFLWLRFFRVYPLHLVMLSLFVVVDVSKVLIQSFGAIDVGRSEVQNADFVNQLVANILLLHSLGFLDRLIWNTPSWSISCEFAAYVLFSFGAASGFLKKDAAVLTLAATGVLCYAAVALSRGTLDVTYDLGLVRALSGFALGMLLGRCSSIALAAARMPDAALSWMQSIVFLVIGIQLSFFDGPAAAFCIPLFVFLAALLQKDRGLIAKVLGSRPLQFLGQISYSLYMTQFFVLTVVGIAVKRLFHVPLEEDPVTRIMTLQLAPWFGDVLLLSCLLLILVVAAFTYQFVEAPARAYGRRSIGLLSWRLPADSRSTERTLACAGKLVQLPPNGVEGA